MKTRSLLKVEQKNCLGIYLGQSRATAVLVSAQAAGFAVSNCFSVSAEADEPKVLSEVEGQQNPQPLGRLLAEACAQRQLAFGDVVVALDCETFTQHNLHSEFTDRKQIAQTVKFDAEDALGIDVSDLAVTFNITEAGDSGSQLNVFATGKKLLTHFLTDLQNNGFDPVTIEPDVTALARFIAGDTSAAEGSHPLFAILSRHACYLIAPPAPGENPSVRTFLTTESQNKNELLSRQIPLTIASAKDTAPINSLKLICTADAVNCEKLTEKLGIQTETIDLAQAANADEALLADCDDPAAFAIAYGAALGQLTKAVRADFRPDFAPYQGKKVLLEKTLKMLSISVTILVLTIGLYFQLRLLKTNEYRDSLQNKLQEQYAVVMRVDEMPKDFLRKLTSELGRVKAGTSAMRTGRESVSQLLTFTLEALNSAPPAIDLQIDSISVTQKNVVIAGSTKSQQHTQLFRTIDKHPRLQKAKSSYNPKKNRANFRLTAVPKKPLTK